MVLYLKESVSPQEVVDAIDNRKAVLIKYTNKEGTNQGARYIEPYAYGVTKAGNPCFRAYQYWGDSKRGIPKWKLFRLDRVDDWQVTDNTFELEPKARGWAAQAFNKGGDRTMAQVYKIVNLNGEEPVTDYEKLKARTKSIQNTNPVKIAVQQQNSNKRKPIGNTGGKKTIQGPITTQNIATQQKSEFQQVHRPTTDTIEEPNIPTGTTTTTPSVTPTQRVLSNDEFTNKIRQRFNKPKPSSGPVETKPIDDEPQVTQTEPQAQQEPKPEKERKSGFFSNILNKLKNLFEM